MKNKILPISAIAILSGSCSSIYKSTQTPDDVYYSPARGIPGGTNYQSDNYQSYTSSNEDDYLRMKVQDHYLWSNLDDYSYWNDSRYDFGYTDIPARNAFIYGLNPYPYAPYGYNAWNPYSFYGYNNWGNWYSPYNSIVYYKSPQAYNKTVGTSYINTYYNRNYNNTNSSNTHTTRGGFGNLFKQVFSSNNNYNNTNSNNWNQPARTFNSNSIPSSGSGGRSGGFNSTGSSSGGGRAPRP